MALERSATDILAGLTRDQVETWAGSTTYGRGRSYQRSGRVQQLSRLPSGELIAWVQGGQRYATRVGLTDDQLTSECSCPVEWSCKHAVAILLDAIAAREAGTEIPLVDADDLRLDLLDAGGDGDWSDHERWDEDGEEVDYAVPQPAVRPDATLRAYLEQHSREQLVDLIEQLAMSFDGVRKLLRERRELATSSAAELVKSARRELARASAEPGYTDRWRGDRSIPSYAPVRQRLDALLAMGHADEVVKLGKQIVDQGIAQVVESHDEGETASAVQYCLDVVYRALPRSSLSPAEQMLWAIDAELADDYGIIDGDEVAAFWELERSPSDWSAVADALSGRVGSTASDSGAKDKPDPYGVSTFHRNYARDKLVNRLIHALEEAGRAEEVIPLCEREATRTGSYERLVNRLMAAERWDEAEEWIRDGIAATSGSLPGIAGHLRASLRELRARHGDPLGVAALMADEFFGRPSAPTFMALKEVSEPAGVWTEVRTAVLNYLETGQMPAAVRPPAAVEPTKQNPWRGRRSRANQTAEATKTSRSVEVGSAWPLPASGLADPAIARQATDFPMIDVLLQIAIAEKRPDDVLRWYERQKQSHRGYGSVWYGASYDDQVATAIVEAYPERSIEIWTRFVDSVLQQANQSNYHRAAEQLEKLRPAYERLGRVDEWRTYVTTLRETHRRRPRLVEILDALLRK